MILIFIANCITIKLAIKLNFQTEKKHIRHPSPLIFTQSLQ